MRLNAMAVLAVYLRLQDLRSHPRLFDERRRPAIIERRLRRVEGWMGVLTRAVMEDARRGNMFDCGRHCRRGTWGV